MADIIGTDGNDTLTGTDGADRISGLAGDDVIDGGLGNDIIDPGAGNDTVTGGGGDDLITLKMDTVNYVSTPAYFYQVAGSGGFDTLSVSANTYLSWRYSNGIGTVQPDGLLGDTSAANFTGFEALTGGDSGNYFNLSTATSGYTITGGLASDTIVGGAGDDYIYGLYGDDTLSGGGGFNILGGGDGNDVFDISDDLGGGTIDGGNGSNTIIASKSVNLVADTADGSYTFENIDNVTINGSNGVVATVIGDIENNIITLQSSSRGFGAAVFDGAGGNDILTGESLADTLRGGDGDDVVVGYAGNDMLFGDAGNDVLSGLEGGDTLAGGDGQDILDGGNGNDSLFGDDGNDQLIGGAGNDVIDGGNGTDTAQYAGYVRDYALTTGRGVSIAAPPDPNNTPTITYLDEGTDTLSNVEYITFRDGFLTFDPASNAAVVARLYDTAFDRAPDDYGLDAQLDLIDAGTGTATIAAAIAGSVEFGGGHALSNGAFVDLLYHNAFDRAAGTDERAYWVGQLDSGNTRGNVLVAISESAEHVADTADALSQGYFRTDQTAQSIAELYDSAFDRRPDVGGFGYWSDEITQGIATVRTVADAFATSTEFHEATDDLSNADYIEYLYHTSFDRTSDADGKAGWMGALNSGATRADLLFQFSQSAEHAIVLAAQINNGIAFG